jgi:hypothetical protein
MFDGITAEAAVAAGVIGVIEAIARANWCWTLKIESPEVGCGAAAGLKEFAEACGFAPTGTAPKPRPDLSRPADRWEACRRAGGTWA